MGWQQSTIPSATCSSPPALVAVPVVVMLVALGFMHIKADIAAAAGLAAALVVAVFAYRMPFDMPDRAALYGGFTGLLPIGWIVLNIIFLQQAGPCLRRHRRFLPLLRHVDGVDRRGHDGIGHRQKRAPWRHAEGRGQHVWAFTQMVLR